MSNEMLENWKKIGETSFAASKELAEISTKTIEQFGEQSMALANLMIESGTEQMKVVSTAKGYKEVISGQSEITADASSKMLGIARNTADIMNEYKDAYTAWFDKSLKAGSSFVPTV